MVWINPCKELMMSCTPVEVEDSEFPDQNLSYSVSTCSDSFVLSSLQKSEDGAGMNFSSSPIFRYKSNVSNADDDDVILAAVPLGFLSVGMAIIYGDGNDVPGGPYEPEKAELLRQLRNYLDGSITFNDRNVLARELTGIVRLIFSDGSSDVASVHFSEVQKEGLVHAMTSGRYKVTIPPIVKFEIVSQALADPSLQSSQISRIAGQLGGRVGPADGAPGRGLRLYDHAGSIRNPTWFTHVARRIVEFDPQMAAQILFLIRHPKMAQPILRAGLEVANLDNERVDEIIREQHHRMTSVDLETIRNTVRDARYHKSDLRRLEGLLGLTETEFRDAVQSKRETKVSYILREMLGDRLIDDLTLSLRIRSHNAFSDLVDGLQRHEVRLKIDRVVELLNEKVELGDAIAMTARAQHLGESHQGTPRRWTTRRGRRGTRGGVAVHSRQVGLPGLTKGR